MSINHDPFLYRVLLVCVKHLGMAPCPRCLIMKSQIHDIGKKFDISQQDRLAWVDNRHWKRTVELARQLLYESGKRPNSKAMAKILGPKSLAPNRVCLIFFLWSLC